MADIPANGSFRVAISHITTPIAKASTGKVWPPVSLSSYSSGACHPGVPACAADPGGRGKRKTM